MNDRRMLLPMSSWDPVLPGKEAVVTARPTYSRFPDEIHFDSRSWVVRRAYLLGALGSETDLALIPSADLPETSPSTKLRPRFAPDTWVRCGVDLCLVVSYVGPNTLGEVFCGAITFYLDWRDPYTRRILLDETDGPRPQDRAFR